MNDKLAHELRQIENTCRKAPSLLHAETSDDVPTWDWLREAEAAHVQQVVDAMLRTPASEWQTDAASLAPVWVELVRRQQSRPVVVSDAQLVKIAGIYGQLSPGSLLSGFVLRFLVGSGTASGWELFASLLLDGSPPSERVLYEVFGDLMRAGEQAAKFVLPRLLDGVYRPALGGMILDYGNFACRRRYTHGHAAAGHAPRLIDLLSQLADRLGLLQEAAPRTPEDVAMVGKQVTESIALAVSLCDALAMIGDPDAAASLHKLLRVEHRRLRVEAATALAKLGDATGRASLLALAAEPAERLRVLAYAEELELLAEVDERFVTPAARAEGEFVMYLAQPEQFSLAPHGIELWDQREQPWPGFDEPQTCFLFRFAYHAAEGDYVNVGMAGPLVYHFTADLTQLSLDDIYALFAGWHVQHPDIRAVAPEAAVGSDEVQLRRYHGSLKDTDYRDAVPALWGRFFGQPVLVAAARRNEEYGWVTVSDDALTWLPRGAEVHGFGAWEAFYLFVGRALLESFRESA